MDILTNQKVVKAVAVDIAAGEGVAKVGANLVAGHVVQVGQVGVVEHNLGRFSVSNKSGIV